MLRKILKKTFSAGKTKRAVKKALLLPSKITVFPFQSHVSVISSEDKNMLRKLGFHNAISTVEKKYLENLGEEELLIINESKKKVEKILEKNKEETKEKKKILERKGNLPVVQKTDPSHILGQGLAMTVDESFKEFYLPSEDVNFNEFTLKKIHSLEDVSSIGTLGTLRLSNQVTDKGKRHLMTFEGVDRINIVGNLGEEEYSRIFEENRAFRFGKLKKRLDMLRKFQASAQSSDFYDNKEIETLENELGELEDQNVNIDEMLEIFGETNLKIIEYSNIPKELFTDGDILKNLVKEIWSILKDLEQTTNLGFTEVPFLDESHQLNLLSAYIAKHKILDNNILQFILEVESPVLKAQIMLDFLEEFKHKYIHSWKLHSEEVKNPESTTEAKQQIDELYKYLRKIQEESSSPVKKMVLKKVRESLENKLYPESIKEIILEELQKFEDINEMYPEFQTIKDFLELVSELPYGVTSQDNYDIKHAKEILDKDHYGMEKVKSRILEFIAVAKLRDKIKGKNMLLVGPPGVGKTSIASSIAECLNREFIRISLGGETDVALLKGHRRTYIGAYPGKLVQALKTSQTENPVILLDEIDKITPGFRGNLIDTLLEVLDPQQNYQFRDNFLEAPLDLSKVLFICSANLFEGITPPVLDRLEVIELSGYTGEEKKEILRRHLLPEAKKKAGIEDFEVEILDEAVEKIVKDYARESGVRGLVKKICRKIVEDPDFSEFDVTPEAVRGYLGVPIYAKQRLYGQDIPVGISIGLGYNQIGGSILFIETSKASFPSESEKSEEDKKSKKKGSIKFTGSLGDVMKESIQIAHTLAKNILHEKFENDYLENNDIHIHFPEGASKKDGPSAGITITSALISLATDKQIHGEIGMTGEISLNGKVLKIGGLREKLLAAKREGLKRVLVPFSNKIDVEELEESIKEGLEIKFVKNYDEVLEILFGEEEEEKVYA